MINSEDLQNHLKYQIRETETNLVKVQARLETLRQLLYLLDQFEIVPPKTIRTKDA